MIFRAKESQVLSVLSRVQALVLDVDGVLTDGTLAYGSDGAESKRFHVADGLGMVVLMQQNVSVAWISGRANLAVERRAKELGIPHVYQKIRDKVGAIQELASRLSLPLEQMAYVGDDWNDLPVFAVAGVCFAVSNAAREVIQAADAVTEKSGGMGAVREVCDAILEAQNRRELALRDYLALQGDTFLAEQMTQ